MEKIEIISDDCPEAIGPYSEGIRVGNLLFTVQIGTNKKGEIVAEDTAEQTAQCLKNIGSIMEAAGAELDDIVKCTVYLTDMDDFEKVNRIYKDFFRRPYPARACIQVGRLPGGVKVEIEVIAYIE